MESTIVPKQEIEARVKNAKEKEAPWKGTHGGTVAGKNFEKSRRARTSHSHRKAQLNKGK
jgi:hypothetical protein